MLYAAPPGKGRAGAPTVRLLTLLAALSAPAGCEGKAGPAGLATGGAPASGSGGEGGSGGEESSGRGGEGGKAPLGDCDAKGSCTTEPTSCVSCSVSEGACVSAFEACGATPDNACFELNACNGQCGGSESCLDACAAQHPAGVEPLVALLTCVWCDDCPVSCAEFESACSPSAPPPDPDADACCKPHDTPGCADASVEACVCDSDAYCCSESWDQFCVERVADLACGECSP